MTALTRSVGRGFLSRVSALLNGPDPTTEVFIWDFIVLGLPEFGTALGRLASYTRADNFDPPLPDTFDDLSER